MRVDTTTAAASAAVLLAGLIGVVATAVPASAALAAVSSTTTDAVPAGATTALAGLGVTVGDAEPVAVTLGTTYGDLTVDVATGITLAYGYSAIGSEIAFTGTGAQVNAALDAVTLTTAPGDKGHSATISIMASPAGTAVFSPSTGHFYEYVADTGVTWSDARDGALLHTFGGRPGYLATVPDDAVNQLIATRINGARNVWLGGAASDDGAERVWTWRTGPRAGHEFSRCSSTAYNFLCDFVGTNGAYKNWDDTEPNNWDGGSLLGESYAVTNWQGGSGLWNDLPPAAMEVEGYVVEYGDSLYGSSSGFEGVYLAEAMVDITGVPDAPLVAGVDNGNGSAELSLTPPASNGGSAVLWYEYSLDNGATWTRATGAYRATGIVVYGLENGVDAVVKVRAVSATGAGAASDPATMRPVVAAVPEVGGPDYPELAPGDEGATSNGEPVQIDSSADRTEWTAQGPGFSLSLGAFDAATKTIPIDGQAGSFVAYTGGYVLANGEGFAPGTTVDLWMFSTPVLLGTATVKADGTFSAMVPMPADVAVGNHTVQVNGLTAARDTVSATIGIKVARTMPAQLAATGAELPIGAAVALVVLGIAMVVIGCRRYAAS